MTITISTIIAAVKRHLSTIGKRLYNKDGKNMFSDITLSSAETELLSQYVMTSVHDIEAVLKQFITSSVHNGTTVVFAITNTRGDDDFDTRVQAMTEAYLTFNTIAQYLSMLHPDLAQKYQHDAQQRMETLIAYVFYKKPPTT